MTKRQREKQRRQRRWLNDTGRRENIELREMSEYADREILRIAVPPEPRLKPLVASGPTLGGLLRRLLGLLPWNRGFKIHEPNQPTT